MHADRMYTAGFCRTYEIDLGNKIIKIHIAGGSSID